ncbi:MAG: DNA-binding protein WhiA [Oscillospiraceae bacterium]|nr:DNA-binding protein WhiA [Oscillospiraceae bacterium]
MSFSAEVKNEILSVETENECCRHAFAYGMMLFSRAFSSLDISLLTEHGGIAEKYCEMVKNICGVTPKLLKSDAGKYKAEVKTQEDRNKVLETFGYDKKTGALRLNWSNITDECCKNAFLRGAFLSCGTVNDPKKGYHLEFVVPYMNLSRDLTHFIKDYDELGIEPKTVRRNSNYVIYFKDSESIEDILTVMGAVNSCLELMGVKMYKDMRNNVNRKLNFESANFDKTIDAAARQIDAIEHIKNTVGLFYLSDELREIAVLRTENPDMSLRELGSNLSTPISRSGVNHRLQKICDIAQSIK